MRKSCCFAVDKSRDKSREIFVDDAARLGYEMTSTTCVPVNDALASFYIRPGNPRTVGARFRSLVCTNKEARATMFLKPLAPLAPF